MGLRWASALLLCAPLAALQRIAVVRAPTSCARPRAASLARAGPGGDGPGDAERDAIVDEARRILEAAQRARGLEARDGDAGGAATGALVGGVLGGPLGFLLGASVGSSWGARSKASKAQDAELAALGVDADLVAQIAAANAERDEASAGREYVARARDSAASFSSALDRDRDAAQRAAAAAVEAGDDDAARDYLKARLALDKRCKVAAAEVADAARRLANVDADVAVLTGRCDDLDLLLARSVVAKSRGDRAPPAALGAPARDPLLARFDDLERLRDT